MRTYLMSLALLPVALMAAERDRDSTLSESWLELQRSGEAASPHVQAASAAERERSLERWLQSFEYPIPESYEQQGGSTVSK